MQHKIWPNLRNFQGLDRDRTVLQSAVFENAMQRGLSSLMREKFRKHRRSSSNLKKAAVQALGRSQALKHKFAISVNLLPEPHA